MKTRFDRFGSDSQKSFVFWTNSVLINFFLETPEPVWLNGAQPEDMNETKKVPACGKRGSKCCYYGGFINVKKCSGFFVYDLYRTSVCPLSYCAG